MNKAEATASLAKNRMLRWFLIAAGTIFLGLGIVGIVLPVLPTTPFLLLAAACYARGSQKFYNWLINNKTLGPYIENYRKGRGISVKVKATAIFFLWLTILLSIFFVIDNLIIRIILIAIAVGVTTHLVMIPTYRG